MKRCFDIFFSAIGLALASPAFLAIAVLIKLRDPGPVFFIQQRTGRDFKTFGLYKFRTMVIGAPEKGPSITSKGDPRVTGIGRFLRETKLDELPQLINVLKGDMSFVGPRPELPKYTALFKDDYEEILKVRPGITDYASIKFSDEESLLKRYTDPEKGYVEDVLPAKIALYKQYIREAGFLTDIKLVLLTLLKVTKQGSRIIAKILQLLIFAAYGLTLSSQ